MSIGSLDLTLIRFLKHKDKLDLYLRGVPMGGVDKMTAVVLQDYDKFFKENPDATTIRSGDFWAYMKLKYPKMKEEAAALLQTLVSKVDEDVAPDVQDGIARRLGELRAALDSGELLQRYQSGEEVDLLGGLRAILERQGTGTFDIPIVKANVGDLLDEDQSNVGIKWRLDCLNQSMRPLRTGDAGILAARVDTGKTTFICSEAAFMGPQMEGYYGERRPVAIMINEGPGKNVKLRLWQAVLGATIPEMCQLKQQGRLEEEVFKAMGGWESAVVVEIHDRPISYIEDVVRRMRPGMVWTDMLDNAPFDGTVANGGQRTDQILEAMYQRQRLWAVLYDTICIATSQLSADGEGELYPKMTHLANSKTGKPGAADFIIMSGTSNDEAFSGLRYIGLPKNKLVRAGAKKDPKATVQFIGDRARLENPIVL